MALKTVVKASEVNNLSDARYCAGMGVEMLGFCLDENHPKFIELARLREISVWVSGVKTVGEFAGDNVLNINYLAEQLQLDYIQLNHTIDLQHIKELKKPVILKLNYNPPDTDSLSQDLRKYAPFVELFLLESEHIDSVEGLEVILKEWCSAYKIILGFGVQKEMIEDILQKIKPFGLEVRGGDEIKPGLKNFEELAEVLEALEID
jgi:phosphoribosylanthranilate isomerase